MQRVVNVSPSRPRPLPGSALTHNTASYLTTNTYKPTKKTMKTRKKPWMTVLRDSSFELSQNVLEDSSMPWAGLKEKKTNNQNPGESKKSTMD